VSNQHRSLRAAIAGWWQGWRDKSAAADIQRKKKIKQAADKLGLTEEEVGTIAAKAHYTSNLLPLRMSLLRLDAAKTALGKPTVFRDLDTSCKLCESKGQCTWDIVEDAANPVWEKYCPNAAKLRVLESETTPKPKSS
jgi:hypothetical protein